MIITNFLLLAITFLKIGVSFTYKHRLPCLRTYKPSISVFNLWSTSNDDDLEEVGSSKSYTVKQILREETEAPFRKIRLFLYFSIISAAGIGTLVSGTKLIAILADARDGDIKNLLSDIGINVGGIIGLSVLWRNEIKSQNSRLDRIQRGGSLASLKVKIKDDIGMSVVKLSDFRRNRGLEKRVVIVIASKAQLQNSLQSSIKESKSIQQKDLLVVPVAIELNSKTDKEKDYMLTAPSLESLLLSDTTTNSSIDNISTEHIGQPVALTAWNEVLKNELMIARKQSDTVLDKGVTIIIKKNGKVGSRRIGVPIWEALANDITARKEAGLDISNI